MGDLISCTVKQTGSPYESVNIKKADNKWHCTLKKWHGSNMEILSMGFDIKLKNSIRIHEENTKENHNCAVSLYVIKTCVTLSWISLQIFLNIFSLRKQKLLNLCKELVYKTFCFLSCTKNSQYVLYWTQNTRVLPCVLYLIKHSCLFFKHYLKFEINLGCFHSTDS